MKGTISCDPLAIGEDEIALSAGPGRRPEATYQDCHLSSH